MDNDQCEDLSPVLTESFCLKMSKLEPGKQIEPVNIKKIIALIFDTIELLTSNTTHELYGPAVSQICQILESFTIGLPHLAPTNHYDSSIAWQDHQIIPLIIQLIAAIYKLCSKSENIGKSLNSEVSNIVKTIFKKGFQIQSSAISLIYSLPEEAPIFSSDFLIVVCIQMSDMALLADQLDHRASLPVWKCLSTLTLKYHEEYFHDRLDLGHICATLSTSVAIRLDNITNNYQALEVKMLVFLVRAFISISKEFSDCLNKGVQEGIRFIALLLRSREKMRQSKSISDECKSEANDNIFYGIEILVSILAPIHSVPQLLHQMDLQPDLKCYLYTAFLSAVLINEDNNTDLWLGGNSSALEEVFSLLSAVEKSSFNTLSLDDLYDFTVRQLSTCICAMSPTEFQILERRLSQEILSQSLVCRLLASDLWCFVSRYGSGDLCWHYVTMVMEAMHRIKSERGTSFTSLGLLLRRLVLFLAPKKQTDLIIEFPVTSWSSCWRFLNLSRLSKESFKLAGQQITKQLQSVCALDTLYRHDLRYLRNLVPLLSAVDTIGNFEDTLLASLCLLLSSCCHDDILDDSLHPLVLASGSPRLFLAMIANLKNANSMKKLVDKLSSNAIFIILSRLEHNLSYLDQMGSIKRLEIETRLQCLTTGSSVEAESPFLQFLVEKLKNKESLQWMNNTSSTSIDDVFIALDQDIERLEIFSDKSPFNSKHKTTVSGVISRLSKLL